MSIKCLPKAILFIDAYDSSWLVLYKQLDLDWAGGVLHSLGGALYLESGLSLFLLVANTPLDFIILNHRTVH